MAGGSERNSVRVKHNIFWGYRCDGGTSGYIFKSDDGIVEYRGDSFDGCSQLGQNGRHCNMRWSLICPRPPRPKT
ncbi:MAG: hypothetical protein WC686_03580 [Candidatus Shapirobacteria bacterium]